MFFRDIILGFYKRYWRFTPYSTRIKDFNNNNNNNNNNN